MNWLARAAAKLSSSLPSSLPPPLPPLPSPLSSPLFQVQLQFANQDPRVNTTGDIGDCRGSQHVCSAFEEILKHGLKAQHWFGQGTSTFWPIVQKISRKEAIESLGRWVGGH